MLSITIWEPSGRNLFGFLICGGFGSFYELFGLWETNLSQWYANVSHLGVNVQPPWANITLTRAVPCTLYCAPCTQYPVLVPCPLHPVLCTSWEAPEGLQGRTLPHTAVSCQLWHVQNKLCEAQQEAPRSSNETLCIKISDDKINDDVRFRRRYDWTWQLI